MSSERNLLGTNGQKVRLVNPRYPFFLAAILVAGGVLGAAANLWQLVAISGAAVLTACTLIIFVRRIKNFCALALICFLAVAWYGWAGYNVKLTEPPEGKVYITGRVCGPVVVNDERASLNLDNCLMEGVDGTVSLRGRVALYIDIEDYSELNYGDVIRVPVSISVPSEPDGPFQPNYRRIMFGRGVYYSAFAGQTPVVEDNQDDFWGVFHRLRDRIDDNIYAALPEEQAVLISGMLLGNDEASYSPYYDKFTELGIVHIFSVSGLHVGIIAYALLFLIKRLGISKKLGFFIVAGILLCYAAICGFSVSITRAVIMFLIMLGASCLCEGYDSLNSLSAACIVLIALSPLCVYAPGFQLSFAACFGIVLFGRLFRCNIPGLKGLTDTAQVTISAQIGTLPLQINMFHSYPLISVLANVVLVPYISVLLTYVFAASFLGLLFSNAGVFLISLLRLPVDVFLFASEGLSNLGVPDVRGGYIPELLVAAYFVLLFFLSRFVNIKLTKKAVSIVCIVVLSVCGIFGYKALEEDKLEIQFLSVGNADCAFIKTPGGKCYMIDTGAAPVFSEYSGNSAENVVLPYLYARGIYDLDGVFLSHGDTDHSGGLYIFPDKIAVKNIYYNSLTIDKSEETLLAEYRKAGCKLTNVQAGETLILDNNVVVKILYPFEGTEPSINTSMVIKLYAYDTTVLFAGDIQDYDMELVSRLSDIECDILKAPHHGSDATFNKTFYDSTQADCIVVSSGRATEKLFEYYGVRVLSTLVNGAVSVFISKNGYTIKESIT